MLHYATAASVKMPMPAPKQRDFHPFSCGRHYSLNMPSIARNSSEKQKPFGGSKEKEPQSVRFVVIDESHDGQRLDNFLLSFSKGVPKSHVYRIVRSGEVRVNKKRATVSQRLAAGDTVRIPPMRISEKTHAPSAKPFSQDELKVLYEDRDILVIDKPAGLAAHGGSGIAFGLIERLRATRPDAPMLELAHRLDRDTSGAIVVCKTRKALVRFQEQIREGSICKRYRLLVAGDWVNERENVKLPLFKYTLPSGERRVRVDREKGLFSHTIFTLLTRFKTASYLEAELKTGRTHQIRVHAASLGFPLVGDAKYGDYEFNEKVAAGYLGVPFKRMFLHAFSIEFRHPVSGVTLRVVSELPGECEQLLTSLKNKQKS